MLGAPCWEREKIFEVCSGYGHYLGKRKAGTCTSHFLIVPGVTEKYCTKSVPFCISKTCMGLTRVEPLGDPDCYRSR